jgi:hypothetical protein
MLAARAGHELRFLQRPLRTPLLAVPGVLEAEVNLASESVRVVRSGAGPADAGPAARPPRR